MTPLEALDKLNTMFLAYAPRDIREDNELNEDLFECIKSALKEYEMMKQTKIIVGCKKINDDDIEKLKSQSMFIGCLEECKVELLFDEETQKKLKALRNIEESLKYGYVFIGYSKDNEPLFQFADTKLYEEIKKNMVIKGDIK